MKRREHALKKGSPGALAGASEAEDQNSCGAVQYPADRGPASADTDMATRFALAVLGAMASDDALDWYVVRILAAVILSARASELPKDIDQAEARTWAKAATGTSRRAVIGACIWHMTEHEQASLIAEMRRSGNA